jgi:uncharacterized membrane protein
MRHFAAWHADCLRARVSSSVPLLLPEASLVAARARLSLAEAAGAGVRPRLDFIDALRGAVIALMVLDHTRDFFGSSEMNPRDVTQPALFLTRWVTHFCAPLFILLAGVSAHLYGSRGHAVVEIRRFLLTRGLWLIALELTLVRVAWTFAPAPDYLILQVIWAIGCSMVILSGLVSLPRWAIGAFGVALIAGHDLFDYSIRPEVFGWFGGLWTLLHEQAVLHPGANTTLLVVYPLVPWVGVMALGYALGPLFEVSAERRRRVLGALGVGAIVAFVGLRLLGGYGDPAPWAPRATALESLLAFIDCEKYPPSLLYLLMTLGPGFVWLALARRTGKVSRFLATMGRTPLLYYVAHLFLLHALAVALAWLSGGSTDFLFGTAPLQKPEGYGLPLPGVYAVALGVVVALYPIGRRFSELKQRNKSRWLSYV